MKLFKKNQFIIYIIVLMLITAGYLNFTTEQNRALETSIQMERKDDTKIADIGDAKLVNGEVIEENKLENQEIETMTKNEQENMEEKQKENISTKNSEENNNENTILKDTIPSSSQNVKEEYFTKSKLERETMYSQIIETYEKILNSNNSLETQKQIATQEITKINNLKNSIMICENLIRTKGFENNIIFVNENSVSIILGANEIKQEEIAQVQNIISRELKVEIENIHISTK